MEEVLFYQTTILCNTWLLSPSFRCCCAFSSKEMSLSEPCTHRANEQCMVAEASWSYKVCKSCDLQINCGES